VSLSERLFPLPWHCLYCQRLLTVLRYSLADSDFETVMALIARLLRSGAVELVAAVVVEPGEILDELAVSLSSVERRIDQKLWWCSWCSWWWWC
jgi:hypothetical protein